MNKMAKSKKFTKKANETTKEEKTTKRIVHKVRNNAKSSTKFERQYEEKQSNQKHDQKEFLITNECSVKSQFQPATSLSSINKKFNTLPAQCTTRSRMRKEDKYNINVNNGEITSKRKSFNIESDHPTQKFIVLTKDRQQKSLNSLPHDTTKRCVVKLRKISTTKKTKDKVALNNTSNFVVRLKKIVSTKDRQRNQSNFLTPGTTKGCAVNLGEIAKTKQTKDKEPVTPNNTRNFAVRLKNIVSTKDRQQNQSNFLTPGTTKRCAVKLRKISATKKTKDKDPATLNNTRNFAVRLKNIGNMPSKSITTTNVMQLHSQKVLIKNNELAGIKQIAKLSLKRSTIRPNTNIANLAHTQPAQNSTLLGSTKSKYQENANEEIKNTPSKDRSSSRNLANKSEEIENVLNSLDNEEENFLNSPKDKNENDGIILGKNCNRTIETENNFSITHNKTNKFFHREENVQENILKDIPSQKTKSPTTQKFRKKRRFYTKRSTVVKRDKIYEFLSQSQTSDSDIAKQADPTADIIKRLIDQGKVRVATNCKGTGKPKLKPQRKPFKENKTSKKLKQLKNNTKKVKFTEEGNNAVEEDHNFEDHFDNDEQLADFEYDMEIQRDTVSNMVNNHNHRNLTNDQEGTFSRLAKSVIIKQAGRSDWEGKHPSVLLTKDLNFVSTPKNRKMPSPQTALETDLSPIPMPLPRPASNTSPWRVNEDVYLPTTFNFSRCSGNLPSFSSDFIPATPRKEKSKIYLNELHQATITSEKSETKSKHNDDLENKKLQTSSSVISSFSSNDSNAENMPPPSSTSENYNENERIFQIPTPQRALNHRSPLKTINIIEVIHLPNFKHLTTIPNKQIEMFGFEENLGDSYQEESGSIALSTEQQNDSLGNTESRPKDDLFGFEDYLSQTEFSSQEKIEINNNNIKTNSDSQTMHEKLQDLRRLKPNENELQESSRNPIKANGLFVDNFTKLDGMRQRGIKEMLTSTMIHPQPTTSKEALRQLKNANLKNTNLLYGEDSDLSQLFKDTEPETTFNENEAHRTYDRPCKRRYRLKESKYIVCLESDHSEDEDKNEQHSRESNSSSEHAPKKKRYRKEPKENPKLMEFVKEFNELCKDVDSYNLVVEKST